MCTTVVLFIFTKNCSVGSSNFGVFLLLFLVLILAVAVAAAAVRWTTSGAENGQCYRHEYCPHFHGMLVGLLSLLYICLAWV